MANQEFFGNGGIEHELTVHLERAHDLARRAKASNSALQEQLRRAQEIADELSDRVMASNQGE